MISTTLKVKYQAPEDLAIDPCQTLIFGCNWSKIDFSFG